MKRNFMCLTALLIYTAQCLFAQNSWTHKLDFPAPEIPMLGTRNPANAIGIGDKGYMSFGQSPGTQQIEFWEFNPASNVWMQKTNIPGAYNLTGSFSSGNKGYFLLSGDAASVNGATNFWEYDPATAGWMPKRPFPGTGTAIGFCIGSKGYFGSAGTINNFWEYDMVSDSWTKKSDYPGNFTLGFSIGSKGYMGMGSTAGNIDKNEFWEYAPATDKWTRKANFPSVPRGGAVGFSIGNKGYIGTGLYMFINFLNDWWEYDPGTDVWTQKASVGASGRVGAIGFSIGNKGYIGLGTISFRSGAPNGGFLNDLWEYTPDAAPVVYHPPAVSFDPISVTTWVGDSVHGYVDGIGRAARFHTPIGVVADKAGNVYVCDSRNERIRKVTKEGVVSTFAGNGIAGYADGTGEAASFNFIVGLAVDSTGNVFAGERGNNALRKITPAGVVTTIVGPGGWGGRRPNFNGLAVDVNGNIFVSDGDRNTILKVSAGGTVSVFAGNGNFAQVDGPGITASFQNPAALVMDHDGNLIVADQNGELRKISKEGIVSTLHVPGLAAGLSATKVGLAVDAGNNIIVTADNIVDYLNFYVYKITPSLNMALLAGSGRGHVDSIGSDARFYVAGTLALDGQGNLFMNEYSVDYGVEFGHWLRKLSKPDLQFTANAGEASGARYFTISANNAFDAVNLNGSAAYEIATNEAGPWFPVAMSIGTNAGELNVMKIYLRLKADLPPGVYNDTIVLTASGAMPQKLGVKGIVREIDKTPPTITCVPSQIFCFNSSGDYTLPPLIATDVSYIKEIHYTVSGATSRSGEGDNASGIFKPGKSIIKWTATDWWSNSSSCETPVVVNMPLKLTIPDVYPLLIWGDVNTLYLGFGPTSVILTASASGGTSIAGW